MSWAKDGSNLVTWFTGREHLSVQTSEACCTTVAVTTTEKMEFSIERRYWIRHRHVTKLHGGTPYHPLSAPVKFGNVSMPNPVPAFDVIKSLGQLALQQAWCFFGSCISRNRMSPQCVHLHVHVAYVHGRVRKVPPGRETRLL